MVQSLPSESVLFIDKFPQFYELANTIQDRSTFILKIFAKPLVLAVNTDTGKLSTATYLASDNTNVPDMYMHLPPVPNDTNPIAYQILNLSRDFQILLTERTLYLAEVSSPISGNNIEIQAMPYSEGTTVINGAFQVERTAIQPNIYKVAEILSARLTFLKDSISPIDANDSNRIRVSSPNWTRPMFKR